MPEGGLGVLLNHPRFLEWLGVPDSAWLLEMRPGHWCDTLTRDQAMSAEMQLRRDACLMQTNLDIIGQYTLALHGTASKMLQTTIGDGPYPRAEVAVAARTSSLGANGGLGTLETFVGSCAVRDGTSLTLTAKHMW